MSFSFTQAEQDRVNAAAALGIRLDPIGKIDMALVIVISVVYGVDLLAVLFLLRHRHWPPIKSKSPGLMAASFASCVCWFIGDLQINGHVHLAGTVLANCKAVGVWVRVLLGVCTVSALMALRSYGLFRVFCQNKPCRGPGLYILLLGYCVCTLICGIVAQVLSPAVTVEYKPALDVCYCPKPFRAALYVYIWATWLLIAAINWKIRNIKSSFNESREMAFSCAVVFAILTLSTALQFARPDYPFNQTLRVLTTAMDHLGTNAVWWTIVGAPLWNCVFCRAEYLKSWTARLYKDGLQSEYDVESGGSGQAGITNTTIHSEVSVLIALETPHGPEMQQRLAAHPSAQSRYHGRHSTHVTPVATQTAVGLAWPSSHAYNPADAFDIRPPPPPVCAGSYMANDPFLFPAPTAVLSTPYSLHTHVLHPRTTHPPKATVLPPAPDIPHVG